MLSLLEHELKVMFFFPYSFAYSLLYLISNAQHNRLANPRSALARQHLGTVWRRPLLKCLQVLEQSLLQPGIET